MGREARRRAGESPAQIRARQARHRQVRKDARDTAAEVEAAVIAVGDSTDLPAHVNGLLVVLARISAPALAYRVDPGEDDPPPVVVENCQAAFHARVTELLLGFGEEDLDEFLAREKEGREEREREEREARADGDSVAPSSEKGEASEANDDDEEGSMNDEKDAAQREEERQPEPPATEGEKPLDPAERLDERARDVDEQAEEASQ